MRQRDTIQFVVVSLVTIAAAFVLLHRPWLVHNVVDPYTAGVAWVSRLALRSIGVEASGHGGVIASPEFSVTIKNVCNGVEVVVIYMAAMLAYPSPWRAKAWGLVLGYPILFVVNLIRIVVLFLLGFKVPDIFEAVHYYYAQAFVIIITVGVWLLWLNRFVPDERQVDQSAAG